MMLFFCSWYFNPICVDIAFKNTALLIRILRLLINLFLMFSLSASKVTCFYINSFKLLVKSLTCSAFCFDTRSSTVQVGLWLPPRPFYSSFWKAFARNFSLKFAICSSLLDVCCSLSFELLKPPLEAYFCIQLEPDNVYEVIKFCLVDVMCLWILHLPPAPAVFV